MKIQIKKNTRGKFFFQVIAGGKVLLESGRYTNKRNLATALSKLKAGLPEAPVVDLV